MTRRSTRASATAAAVCQSREGDTTAPRARRKLATTVRVRGPRRSRGGRGGAVSVADELRVRNLQQQRIDSATVR